MTEPFQPEKAVLHFSPLSSWILTFAEPSSTLPNRRAHDTLPRNLTINAICANPTGSLGPSFDHAESVLAISVGQTVTSLQQHGVWRLATTQYQLPRFPALELSLCFVNDNSFPESCCPP